MKKLIIFLLALYSYLLISPNMTYAVNNTTLPPAENIETGAPSWSNNISNKLLDDLKSSEDIKVWNEWEKSILYFLFTAAKDLKTVFYIISGLYFLILVIKLLFSNNTDDEVSNFKKGILWISIWILLMQISFYFVNILYAQQVWWALANTFTSNVINPIIKALETAASFFFMLIAIYAFYRIITANWDEEKVKTWKMSIIYWLIGFVVIKVAKEIVSATYWKIDCNDQTVFWIFQINGNKCNPSNQLSWVGETIVNLINWMNSFVWIIVIIMIIYVGIQVLFWTTWDDDRLSKVKKSITYIIIWIAILVLNFFILWFFINPETTI